MTVKLEFSLSMRVAEPRISPKFLLHSSSALSYLMSSWWDTCDICFVICPINTHPEAFYHIIPNGNGGVVKSLIYIQWNISTLLVMPMPSEQLIALCPSIPAVGLIPTSVTYTNDIANLRCNQGSQFIPFVLHTVYIARQTLQMCSSTHSTPWSGSDAPIGPVSFRQCHTIPWRNSGFLILCLKCF